MTAQGPVDVFVDLDALISLQADLQAVRAGLDAFGAAAACSDPRTVGSAAVAHAVDAFVDGWRDGRQRITDELSQCIAGLADAIAAYQHGEAALRAVTAGTGR